VINPFGNCGKDLPISGNVRQNLAAKVFGLRTSFGRLLP
jgi:hypothetical protein